MGQLKICDPYKWFLKTGQMIQVLYAATHLLLKVSPLPSAPACPGLLCPGVKNEKWWQGAGTSQQELVRSQCKDRWHLYSAGTAGFFLELARPEQGTITGLLVHFIVTAPAPVKQNVVVVVTIWRGNVAHAAISILR